MALAGRSLGRLLIVCAAILLGASAPIQAARVSLTSADTGFIVSPVSTQEGRLLARFDLPNAVVDGAVELAVLELRVCVTCSNGGSGVTIDAFPVTREWNGATVDWGDAWATPGGDFDRSVHAAWCAARGASSIVRFDVTDMVAAWASQASENRGLIVEKWHEHLG